MGKHWKPRKQTVALDPAARPSRIRRDPVRSPDPVSAQKAFWRSAEWEVRLGVSGVVMFGVAIATAVVGIAAATVHFYGAAETTPAARFGSCDNEGGPDCVIDGGNIRLSGARLAIAGLAAPRIDGAGCAAEQRQGHDAAERLIQLLNTGPVSAGTAFRGPDGREVRKVLVNGDDVAPAMISAGLARHPASEPADWCS